MDKLGYERGLVRYTTEHAMQNKWTKAQTWRHVFRPRVLVYTSILVGIVIAMLVSLATRTQFKVNVVRDRGVMARIVDGGKLENLIPTASDERDRENAALQNHRCGIAEFIYQFRQHCDLGFNTAT